MKTVLRTICVTGVMAGMLTTGYGQPPIGGTKGSGKTFTVSAFYDNMIKGMEGKTVGYGFTIAHNGLIYKAYAGGNARLAIDVPATKYETNTRQAIGSCSKTITALAVFKALEAKKLDEKAEIAPFLPTGWVLPAANKKLTFADVMSHKAGLSNFGGTWAALKKTVETPTTGLGNYKYDNVNYTLCRVLLAYLIRDRKEIESGFNPDFLTCTMYLDYVRTQILKPCGVVRWKEITLGPWSEGVTDKEDLPKNMTRYYNYSKPTLNGITRWTTILEAGPGGFYMNPTEVAQVMVADEQEKIVSKQMMKDMKEKKLGFDGQVDGDHGAYVWKNGVWKDGESTFRGIYTVIMHFPNNVQLVFHTNARVTDIGDVESAIAKAYDKAWL